MVKVLLKKSDEEAGILVEVDEDNVARPTVINYGDDTYARSHVPEFLRLCGSCAHLTTRAPTDTSSCQWVCGADGKDTPYSGTCRNGDWFPEVAVYRKVRRLRVVAAPPREDPLQSEDLTPVTGEVTQVVPWRKLPLRRDHYVAASLFFAASAMFTLWILQRCSGG